jgi:hypothetical protein
VDVFGTIQGTWSEKFPATAPYRYSVVIENEHLDWWFTEKIIDCFSVGTVPIYWGCPDIGRFFDIDGVIPFNNLDELATILENISPEDYKSRLKPIRKNLKISMQYRIAENWMFSNYPFLFRGS